jgi:hypothetical protein
MTVQTGIELDVDIAAMVGELEAPPCESANHADPKYLHHEGQATHYVQSFHPCAGPVGMITARCTPAANAIKSAAQELAKCEQCGDMGPLSKFIIVLGPIQ